MAEGSRLGGRRALVRDDDPPADDDFLFHLSRSSELLVQNRVVEAKEELERALAVRPRDAQGTDLLAGVYFRLGVYPTAIELWRELIAEFPDDPILRVNLGLALFKTGQPEEARQHLETALAIDPGHERAWGYLGLTLWRLGRLDEARDAFLRGGQLSMAQRMAEAIEAPGSTRTRARGIADAQMTAVRDAASEAVQRMRANTVSLSVEEERPRAAGGEWTVLETGADSDPRVPGPSHARPSLAPPALEAAVARWTVTLAENTPLAVGSEGELLVSSRTAVCSRLSGLRAVRGPLRWEPVQRRYRTRDSDEPLGGEVDPIVRWQGPVAAVLAPPNGLRYHALRIGGSLLYVREALVHAFDGRVGYESGELPLAGEPVILLSFHGEGTIVLRLPRSPSGLEVRPDDEVHVDPSALVGWTGRLFPSAVAEPHPPSAPLAFRGEGIVLVT